MNAIAKKITSESWEENIKSSLFSISEIEYFIEESYKNGYVAKDEEVKIRARDIFSNNIRYTDTITKDVINHLSSQGINLMSGFLKIDRIFNFSIIFTVSLEDYLSDNILKAYDWVSNIEKTYRTNSFFIDISFMYEDKHLNLESLAADGFKFTLKNSNDK